MVFEFNKTYDFSTTAPVELGLLRQNMTFLGSASYDIALAIEKQNIQVRNSRIYPELPAGTPKDYTKYQYHIFKNSSGAKEVFAEYWIDPSTVTLRESLTLSVTVSSATNADMTKLRDLLTLNGYRNFNIAIL